MIKVTNAICESRIRDRKRKRLILRIGDQKWHIDRKEAKQLLGNLRRHLSD